MEKRVEPTPIPIMTMKICSGHSKVVPVMMSQSYLDSEYWCPYCGGNEAKDVESTAETRKLWEEWYNKSKEYTHALSSLKNDEDITAIKKDGSLAAVTKAKKAKLEKIVSSWVYEGK